MHEMGSAGKELIRRWFEDGWQRGRLEVAAEIFAPGFVLNGEQVGPDRPVENVAATRSAFPDIVVTIEHQVAEGDLVATHFVGRGTHRGPWAGIPATGRRIDVTGVILWRISDDGLVTHDWTVFDLAGLKAQMQVAA